MRSLPLCLLALGLLAPTPAAADVGLIGSAGVSLGRSRFSGRTFKVFGGAEDLGGRTLTTPVTAGDDVSSPLTTALETTLGVRVRNVYFACWTILGTGRSDHGPAVRAGESVWSRTGGVDLAAAGGEAGVRLALRPTLRLWAGARGGFEVVDLDLQRVGAQRETGDRQQSFVAVVGPTAALEWHGLAFVAWADALHLGTVRAGLRWQLDI